MTSISDQIPAELWPMIKIDSPAEKDMVKFEINALVHIGGENVTSFNITAINNLALGLPLILSMASPPPPLPFLRRLDHSS